MSVPDITLLILVTFAAMASKIFKSPGKKINKKIRNSSVLEANIYCLSTEHRFPRRKYPFVFYSRIENRSLIV